MNDVVLYVMKNIIPIMFGFVLVMVLWVVIWSFASRKKKAPVSPAETMHWFFLNEPRAEKVHKRAWTWESDEHRALLVICGGDHLKAEHLIDIERSKNLSGDREAWILSALRKWGGDLHRL